MTKPKKSKKKKQDTSDQEDILQRKVSKLSNDLRELDSKINKLEPSKGKESNKKLSTLKEKRSGTHRHLKYFRDRLHDLPMSQRPRKRDQYEELFYPDEPLGRDFGDRGSTWFGC